MKRLAFISIMLLAKLGAAVGRSRCRSLQFNQLEGREPRRAILHFDGRAAHCRLLVCANRRSTRR